MERIFWVLGAFLVLCLISRYLGKLSNKQYYNKIQKEEREKKIGKTGF